MAKYYVESATLELVIQADDPYQASLWAVSRALQQIFLDPERNPAGDNGLPVQPAGGDFLLLDQELRVNEFGFGHTPYSSIETAPLVSQCGQLMSALRRIEKEGPFHRRRQPYSLPEADR
ncbi:MAG: hypothetical protein CMJ59_17090 [Planctomycetaceae bacterium]|nr:hypothetical protein [Planctomycetaceae bacterium]